MSDKSEGPGWWIASDGKWYPPELHPSVREESTTAPSMQGLDGVPRRRWDDDPSKATHVGPQFPDLFQKALQGSHLADNVTVANFADDASAGSFSSSRAGGASRDAAPVGASTGSSSRRKWRKGH